MRYLHFPGGLLFGFGIGGTINGDFPLGIPFLVAGVILTALSFYATFLRK